MVYYRTKSGNFALPGIEECHELKILGVHWNVDLTWRHHFDHILSLSSQRLYVVRVLKTQLSTEQLILVYKSIVLSILLYAAPLFISLPKGLTMKLEKFNTRVHRIICGKDCPCDLFPPLSSLREQRARKFFTPCETFKGHPLHHLVPS